MTSPEQKVFFDGAMHPVAMVADLLRESGKDTDFILRRIGFLLGFDSYAEPVNELGHTNRYPCTFECVVQRYNPKG